MWKHVCEEMRVEMCVEASEGMCVDMCVDAHLGGRAFTWHISYGILVMALR